jgi:hypothetical protein
MLNQLEDAKAEILNTEMQNKDIIAKMERKFDEEKFKIRSECNLKMLELAATAHKKAVDRLDETTKDAYKENMRLTEALNYHAEERTELNRLNAELLRKNQALTEQNEFQSVLVKGKVVQAIEHEALVD